jgi:hypothetical protein
MSEKQCSRCDALKLSSESLKKQNEFLLNSNNFLRKELFRLYGIIEQSTRSVSPKRKRSTTLEKTV